MPGCGNAETLTIPADNTNTITIPSGVTVTNSGTITGAGTLSGSGTITNSGSIVHTVTVEGDDGLTVTDHHYAVTFDADGGTGAPSGLTLYAATFARAGLTLTDLHSPEWGEKPFGDWHLDSQATGSALDDDSAISNAASDGTPVPVPLYAGWAAGPDIVTATLPDGQVGVAYRAALEVTGDGAPFIGEITADALPPGLLLDGDTGVISGKPTAGGPYRLAVTVTDANHATAHRELLLSIDAAACATPPFPDVPVTGPNCGAIAWIHDRGITGGYVDGKFHADLPVTRQTMSAFLYRLEHDGATAPACTTAPFSGVPASSPFCGAIAWAAGDGILTGTGAGPTGDFRRLQVVTAARPRPCCSASASCRRQAERPRTAIPTIGGRESPVCRPARGGSPD